MADTNDLVGWFLERGKEALNAENVSPAPPLKPVLCCPGLAEMLEEIGLSKLKVSQFIWCQILLFFSVFVKDTKVYPQL